MMSRSGGTMSKVPFSYKAGFDSMLSVHRTILEPDIILSMPPLSFGSSSDRINLVQISA